MDCGFETVGNATVICYDEGPVLCTDPWFVGDAYFGSWTLSHEVPEAQQQALRGCQYVWLSHGHPDHLSVDSLNQLKDKKILLPDHVGGRVKNDLVGQGFDVHVLPDRVWTPLSPRVRVLSIADYNQDGVLLIDLDGTLVVNLNDASDRGWGRFVRRTIQGYDRSFLLALTGYGDAGMINVFDEDGRRVAPEAAKKNPVGQKIARLVERYPARYFVPFSSMHRYQRTDSLWADPYSTRMEDYAVGYDAPRTTLLKPFVSYDVGKEELRYLSPKESKGEPKPPEAFGDDWSERLEKGEAAKITRYFRSIAQVGEVLDFVTFKVGGESHVVTFRPRGFSRGLTFEAPRHSLLTAIDFEVFDDLLIGNFMKTTKHGEAKTMSLDAEFTPYVAKYADNGRAKSKEEVRRYLATYRRRDPIGFLHQAVERGVVRPSQETASRLLREKFGERSPIFRAAKRAFWGVRKALP